MSSMFDINTADLLLNFHGKYIPSKFVFTSDDRILYVGYAVDCLFKVIQLIDCLTGIGIFCRMKNTDIKINYLTEVAHADTTAKAHVKLSGIFWRTLIFHLSSAGDRH